jgi:hypothetical protein
MRVPFGIVGVIESSILFCLLAGEIVTHYRVILTRRLSTPLRSAPHKRPSHWTNMLGGIGEECSGALDERARGAT